MKTLFEKAQDVYGDGFVQFCKRLGVSAKYGYKFLLEDPKEKSPMRALLEIALNGDLPENPPEFNEIENNVDLIERVLDVFGDTLQTLSVRLNVSIHIVYQWKTRSVTDASKRLLEHCLEFPQNFIKEPLKRK